MSKKLTYEYVKEYIASCGYKLISDIYINAHQHLLVECDNHHRYSVNFNNFKNGKRCPECAKLNSGSQRRLQYDFVKYNIEENGQLKLLSKEYKNNSTPLLLQCNNSHIFKMPYSSLQTNEFTCPKCNKESLAKELAFTFDEVKEYIESQGYTLLSKEYKNAGEILKMQCPQGHEVKMRYNNFRIGKRCKICSMKQLGDDRRFSFLQIKEYIESFAGYKLLSTEYLGSNKKLIIQCPSGHIFLKSYNKFRAGERCSICSESKGEYKTRLYLHSNNVIFYTQYSFDDCRNKEPLRFDFAIFNINKKLLLLVEYDGEFHYEPIEGKSKLKYQQKLDNIKNDYCKKNNIPLLRIPYWEFDNIEKILSDELLKYNLITK